MVNWQRISPWAALVWAVIVQIMVVVVLGARLDVRQNYLEEQIRLDARDLRVLIERIDRLETPLSKKVDNDIKRLDERMDRIVHAIDVIYNELVQHQRNHPK